MFRALTCPSSGGQIVLSHHLVSSLSVRGCTVCRMRAVCSHPAQLHFMQLWPLGTQPSQLHKMYQSQCKAKNSWWWAENLPETRRAVIPIKLEFVSSVGFIHKESHLTYPVWWTTFQSQHIALVCEWSHHRLEIMHRSTSSVNRLQSPEFYFFLC